MSSYVPIDCNDYDFLEIACMDGYQVEVKIDSGTLIGVATGLETRFGEEYLTIQVSGGLVETIRIDRIVSLEVLTEPARFRRHDFIA